VRGPGASTYSDEVAVAEEVAGLLDAMATNKIEIKLGHIPDDQRRRLLAEMAQTMKRHKLDILRVLLAKEMVAEAQQIARLWVSPDRREPSRGRRYSDLLFSARALLPPGYDWDLVTYDGVEGKVCWSHQLAYDKNGHRLEGVRYDAREAEMLLEEFKGTDRGLTDSEALTEA
jgi:hypothetical protein